MLEILGKIGFDWHLAIASLINFVVVFLVLKKMFFGPISATIEARRKKIEDGLLMAEESKLALEQAEKQKEEIIGEAKKEASLIVDKSIKKAKMAEEEIIEKAQQSTAEMKSKALSQIAKSEEEMRTKLEDEVAELSILSARKIMQGSNDQNKIEFAKNMSV